MSDKAHPAQLRKLRFAIRVAEVHLPPHLPPLFALTDPRRTPDPIKLALALPNGSGLIYRHFGEASRAKIAFNLAKIARRKHLSLLIGNDPQLALKVRAAGVHWPEARLHEARKWRSRFCLMTGAAHTRRALAQAAQTGLDGALLSTVYNSKSPSAKAPMGAHKFRQLAANSPLPVYALGGVNAETAGKISKTGGMAMIGGINKALLHAESAPRI